MKKLFTVLLALSLIAAFALSCRAVEFSCAIPQVKGGQKTELSLCVDEGSNLFTAEFVLTYDVNSYRFTGTFAPGDACEGLSPYLNVTESEPGRIKVIYTATEPLTASGALCTLGFQAARRAEKGAFGLTAEHAETFDGEHIRKLSVAANGTQGVIEPAANTVAFLGCALAVLGACLCVIALVLKKKKGKKAAQ